MTLRSSLVAVAGAIVLAAHAAPASAVITSLRSGAAISFQPAPGSGAHTSARVRANGFDAYFRGADYNGGPVMPSNGNYLVFWRPPGEAPEYPAKYKSGLETFFTDLAAESGRSSNVDSVAAQYNDAAGQFASYESHFEGALIDEHPYPARVCTRAPKCLTDAQIRAELVRFVKEKGRPTDLRHEYFLLTPEGVESCFEPEGFACSANAESHQVYCAYHGNIPLPGGGELIYSNDPFVNGKNCDEPADHPNGPSDSALAGGLSHEHVESITDPEPNSGWTDFGSSEVGEVGDKCRSESAQTEFGEPLGTAENGAKYNQLINGDKYWYQQEWSNKGAKCLQRLSFKASEAPVATFTGVEGPSGEIKFNAAGSSAGEGERYNWQWNDRPYPQNTPFETQELQTFHFFSEGGVHTVALTVFKSDGTSYGTARNVTVRSAQVIAFTSRPPITASVGGLPYQVGAVSTSGLPVSLSIDPSSASVCSMTGHTVSFVGAGLCTIDAGQAGSPEVAPAAPAQQAFAVGPPAYEPPPPPPGSVFLPLGVTLTARTGAVTFTESVFNPGTFTWMLTFPNGRFGAFSASKRMRSVCKPGFLILKRKCRPARVVFASGSGVVPARGPVSFTATPTAAAIKALKAALKQNKSLPVNVTLTFQAFGGGVPVSQTQSLSVRLKK